MQGVLTLTLVGTAPIFTTIHLTSVGQVEFAALVRFCVLCAEGFGLLLSCLGVVSRGPKAGAKVGILGTNVAHWACTPPPPPAQMCVVPCSRGTAPHLEDESTSLCIGAPTVLAKRMNVRCMNRYITDIINLRQQLWQYQNVTGYNGTDDPYKVFNRVCCLLRLLLLLFCVCVCVCVSGCTCVYVYLHVEVYVYVYVYAHMYACQGVYVCLLCVRAYVRTSVCVVSVCMLGVVLLWVRICAWACVCACMCVCAWVCLCVGVWVCGCVCVGGCVATQSWVTE